MTSAMLIKNGNWKLKILFLLKLYLFAYSKQVFGQYPCKKVVVSACIDLKTELHIKHGKMWWVWNIVAPGADPNCPGKTTVNDNEWKESSVPFSLNFATDFCSATISKLLTNEISKPIQMPSNDNEWETVWLFADPQSPGANRYSISISFCPINKRTSDKTPKSKPKNNLPTVNKDSLKETKSGTKIANIVAPAENVICKVYFETNKAIITKNSEQELSALCSALNANNLLIEISGYKSGDNLKLYEERSFSVDNFLVSKGVAQKRIKYIGYGEGEKKNPFQKGYKYCIVIN